MIPLIAGTPKLILIGVKRTWVRDLETVEQRKVNGKVGGMWRGLGDFVTAILVDV
jgi:hypothetical protein